MYMRHNDVYILAVTKSNANVMLSFQFMTQVSQRLTADIKCEVSVLQPATGLCYFVQIVALFKNYFGGEFNEQSIKSNFVLIYELLDEILDFGYPQVLP